MATAKLRVINSEGEATEFELPEHAVILGRIPPSDILLPHPSVSRRHAKAELQDGCCRLTDLDSHNGIVVDGQRIDEVLLAPGERFVLGEVELEFALGPPVQTAAAAGQNTPAVPESSPSAAQPAPLSDERTVSIDELFGPADGPAQTPHGVEEEAAVKSAWGALQFLGVVAILIVIGGIAWYYAGATGSQSYVYPVSVRVGESKVIDLGRRVTQRGSTPRIFMDWAARYTDLVYPEGTPGTSVASVEIDDNLSFMATVTGHDTGHTDVYLYGPNNRRCILRIVVTPGSRDPFEEERRSIEARIGEGKSRIQRGRAARARGALYQAKVQFREAAEVLRPVRTDEGRQAYREAYDLFLETRDEVDRRFEDLKRQAIIQYQDRDRVGALNIFRQMRELIPDESDRRRQELEIIYNRTLYEFLQEGA